MAIIYKTSSPKGKRVRPRNGSDYSLEELQAVVKGNIELVHLPFNMLMVVNEEGALNRSDINIKASLIANTIIYGDVLVCKAEEVK